MDTHELFDKYMSYYNKVEHKTTAHPVCYIDKAQVRVWT